VARVARVALEAHKGRLEIPALQETLSRSIKEIPAGVRATPVPALDLPLVAVGREMVASLYQLAPEAGAAAVAAERASMEVRRVCLPPPAEVQSEVRAAQGVVGPVVMAMNLSVADPARR